VFLSGTCVVRDFWISECLSQRRGGSWPIKLCFPQTIKDVFTRYFSQLASNFRRATFVSSLDTGLCAQNLPTFPAVPLVSLCVKTLLFLCHSTMVKWWSDPRAASHLQTPSVFCFFITHFLQ